MGNFNKIDEFHKLKTEFEKKLNTELLLQQLKALDKINTENEGYSAFGCEIILSLFNADPVDRCWSPADLLEEEYENVRRHSIFYLNDSDMYLYYNPNDIRGFLFDFSCLYKEGIILTYDGLQGEKKLTRDIVREFTPDEFLEEYGMKCFFSISHWKVNWKNIGYSWNN